MCRTASHGFASGIRDDQIEIGDVLGELTRASAIIRGKDGVPCVLSIWTSVINSEGLSSVTTIRKPRAESVDTERMCAARRYRGPAVEQ